MSETTVGSAFEQLVAQRRSKDEVHRIRAASRVEGKGPEAKLIIELPLAEVARSRPGTGTRRGLGFALEDVAFDLNGSPFKLKVGWIVLSAR